MLARGEVVIPGVVAYYHCIARCVRRAFLCGIDTYSSRNYEHRREWIQTRLAFLLEFFAIELAAYAVMSNHLHSVIKTRPDIAASWSDAEVARRWLAIFPGGVDEKERESAIKNLALDSEKIALYRKRLSCVSWFNRCLNENIARRANKEDKVTGRFWEGRFKCQLLKDPAAVLGCSMYVELNPIRAGIVQTPEASDYTSIQDRIRELSGSMVELSRNTPRLLPTTSIFGAKFTLASYVALVDATGRAVVTGKHSIPEEFNPILERLGIIADEWIPISTSFRKLFRRVVGTEEQIKQHARAVNRSRFHGIGSARRVFTATATVQS